MAEIIENKINEANDLAKKHLEKTMCKKYNNFYVTTPIYYVNEILMWVLHIQIIAADVMNRYRKSMGDAFLTGTDEHGQKVEQNCKRKRIYSTSLDRSYDT